MGRLERQEGGESGRSKAEVRGPRQPAQGEARAQRLNRGAARALLYYFYFFTKFYISMHFGTFTYNFKRINLQVIVFVVLLRNVGFSDHIEGAISALLG